jgi:hypothetical protein
MARDANRRRGIVLAMMGGALATFFFDPQSGRRRRAVARDRSMATIRRGRRTADRRGRAISARSDGMAARAASLAREERPPEDDITLARKVETVIFRDAYVPKGQINVDAVNGVVTLRGEARNPEMIRELERQAASIPGVLRVENLLHLPSTPAPHAAPGTQGRPWAR